MEINTLPCTRTYIYIRARHVECLEKAIFSVCGISVFQTGRTHTPCGAQSQGYGNQTTDTVVCRDRGWGEWRSFIYPDGPGRGAGPKPTPTGACYALLRLRHHENYSEMEFRKSVGWKTTIWSFNFVSTSKGLRYIT